MEVAQHLQFPTMLNDSQPDGKSTVNSTATNKEQSSPAEVASSLKPAETRNANATDIKQSSAAEVAVSITSEV